MKIGIDGGCWSNRRGYGRFLRELLHELVAIDDRNEFTIILDPDSTESFPVPDCVRRVVVKTAESVREAATDSRRRSISDLLRFSAAAARERFDVFFFPSVYSYFPLIRPVPMLLGIHDTMADQHPKFAFASDRERRFWNWKVRLALAQARRIITVSNYSKGSIQRQFEWRPDRIDVIYEAASPHFYPTDSVDRENPYILYVGGISPNKNLATLIRGFAHLRLGFPEYKLVVAGDYAGDGFKGCYHDLKKEIEAHALGASVVFPGFVPEEQLCGLYGGASVFAFPSVYEGFGLPVLEAMACGAPVVAGRGHAVDEVVGDAGILVDPNDDRAIASAMERILRDPAVALQLRQKSVLRAAEFSWRRAAEGLLASLRKVSGGAS